MAERGTIEQGISPWVLLALGAAMLAPLAVTPVLPLIDLYNHLARFHVLARLGGDPFLAANYAENWRLLPNVGFDYAVMPLVGLVPPLALAKLVVGVTILTQFGGILALARALTGRVNGWTALLAASLSWSFVLNWGFINFLLGFGLSLWTLAAWVRLRERPVLASAVCGALSLMIFLAHGFAFALYGLMLGGLELGWRLSRGERSIGVLARSAGLLALQAVFPILIFLHTATAGATSRDGSLARRMQRIGDGDSLIDRLSLQFHVRWESLYRVAETPWPLLDLVLFLAIAALLGWALRRGVLRIASMALPAMAIGALLLLALPNGLFGAGHLPERVPLLLGAMMAASLAVTRPAAGARRALGLLAAMSALRLLAICAGWGAYRDGYQDFREVTGLLPRQSILATQLVMGDDLRDGLYPRCQMYGPLAVMERGAATSLFADPAQQPMRQQGRLLALVESLPPPSGSEYIAIRLGKRPFRDDDDVAAIAAGRRADFLLICGEEGLKRRLPRNLERVARKGQLSLYRIR